MARLPALAFGLTFAFAAAFGLAAFLGVGLVLGAFFITLVFSCLTAFLGGALTLATLGYTLTLADLASTLALGLLFSALTLRFSSFSFSFLTLAAFACAFFSLAYLAFCTLSSCFCAFFFWRSSLFYRFLNLALLCLVMPYFFSIFYLSSLSCSWYLSSLSLYSSILSELS